ncbi:hypothetical protein A3712_06930 [Vibrio sp. HI00D65]|uniref:hypothetical protein n=1 Tax=Vibrio sp. HI00D65 TaxID=1822216 RepID=UPI0007B89942|nr:hypothetical protein [Vibrio sp. HI00D65]KZX55608.1 hypothetical protein A3712_06930 [Vibrio sp. HI00D65]
MPKFFIHIGSPKTGSTAIQDVLNEMQESGVLARNNSVYPSVGRNKGGGQTGFRKTLLVNKSNEDLVCQEKYENIFESALLHNKDIIISSEQLWTASPKRLLITYPILKKFEIIFVCFLREQTSMIKSHYKQKVKSGLLTVSFEEFFEKNKSDYDYNKKISSWVTELNPHKAIVFSYEKESKGSIIESFFNRIAENMSKQNYCENFLENISKETKERYSNVAISDEALLIIAGINNAPFDESLKEALRKKCIKNNRKLAKMLDLEHKIFPVDVEERIKDFYKPSNDIIEQEFFND